MKKALKTIGKLLTLLSFVFIIYAVWKLGLDFSDITDVPSFLLIVAAGTLIKTGTVFISGYVWCGWLAFFARKTIDRKEGIRVYTKANTGKYLPGNVMQYVERNLFADQLGIGQARIAASSLIEVISLVLVALVTAFLFSYSQLARAIEAVRNQLGGLFVPALIAAGTVGILAAAAVCILFRKKVSAILREYPVSGFLRQLAVSMAGQALVLILLGVVFVLLYLYMGGTATAESVTAIVAGYIISWVLGFVVPGAPGGIGIREMVLTLLVGSVVGQELVLTIALIHRLITIVGDFAAFLLGALLKQKRKNM